MKGKIEFFADVPSEKWVVVKKLEVDEDTSKLELARFLASVHMTLNNKMFQFIGESLDLKALNELVEEITGAKWDKKKGWILKGRVGEEKISSILAKLKSPAVSKKLAKIVKNKKELELAKVYLTRNVLEALKFQLEPDPGLIEKIMNA